MTIGASGRATASTDEKVHPHVAGQPQRQEAGHREGPAGFWLSCPLSWADGGHGILPSGGHGTARSWPTELPSGGQVICPR